MQYSLGNPFALGQTITNRVSAVTACVVQAVVAVVNILIIKYSVNWWNTLHQPAHFYHDEKAGHADGDVVAAVNHDHLFLLFLQQSCCSGCTLRYCVASRAHAGRKRSLHEKLGHGWFRSVCHATDYPPVLYPHANCWR